MADEKPEPEATPAAGEPPPVDDELVKIPRTVRRRSPIVALAVIAVAGLLLYRLVDDSRFALAGDAPIDLGDARALGLAAGGASDSKSALADNRYVAVRGMPDRRNALLFEPKGDSYRRGFYRLLGTDTRLLVRADETSTRHALDERFVGRLRRFDAIPFAGEIRGYYAHDVKATRFLDLAVLKRSLGDRSVALWDRTGDPAKLAATDEVSIEVDFPEDLKISLTKKQFAIEEDARHEAEQLGVPVGPAVTTSEGYIFVVRTSGNRDAFLKKLEEHGFPFAARRERFHARAGELVAGDAPDSLGFPAAKENPVEYQASGAQLTAPPLGARTSIPWSRIASVQFAAPITIPSDAWILVENEAPSGFTWVLLIDALLGLFVGFNLWQLARLMRRRAAA